MNVLTAAFLPELFELLKNVDTMDVTLSADGDAARLVDLCQKCDAIQARYQKVRSGSEEFAAVVLFTKIMDQVSAIVHNHRDSAVGAVAIKVRADADEAAAHIQGPLANEALAKYIAAVKATDAIDDDVLDQARPFSDDDGPATEFVSTFMATQDVYDDYKLLVAKLHVDDECSEQMKMLTGFMDILTASQVLLKPKDERI